MYKLLFLLLLVGCSNVEQNPPQNKNILIEYNGCKYKIPPTAVTIKQDANFRHVIIVHPSSIMMLDHDDLNCKNPTHHKSN